MKVCIAFPGVLHRIFPAGQLLMAVLSGPMGLLMAISLLDRLPYTDPLPKPVQLPP
jgi:hypothetical protein